MTEVVTMLVCFGIVGPAFVWAVAMVQKQVRLHQHRKALRTAWREERMRRCIP